MRSSGIKTVPLVRIAKDWNWPNLLRQTPGGRGAWDGFQFTTDDVESCHALVVLNNRMNREVRVSCPKSKVWAVMQEPYARGYTDWMVEGHEPFARVLTHHPADSSQKYIVSHPAVPWHVNRTFDQLTAMQIPEKRRPLSWVEGNCRDLPGHWDRLEFLRTIQREQDIPADLFGRAVHPIDDKWTGLAPYRFSLAAENTVGTDYWTEKLADCFLAWTIPIYHGCPNVSDYFPPDSFISIDIRKPGETLAVIRKILAGGAWEWERRLPALAEARRRVLYQHQFFPHLVKMLLNEDFTNNRHSVVHVPPYRRSLKSRLWWRILKTNMAIRRGKKACPGVGPS